MGNNSTLKKVSLMDTRNAKLLRLVKATFDSKVAFLRRIRKNKFDNFEKFVEKVCQFLFYLFVVVDI